MIGVLASIVFLCIGHKFSRLECWVKQHLGHLECLRVGLQRMHWHFSSKLRESNEHVERTEAVRTSSTSALSIFVRLGSVNADVFFPLSQAVPKPMFRFLQAIVDQHPRGFCT